MNQTISNKLKEALSLKNISINKLAEMSNVPIETIKNIYYGRNKNTRIETLYAICEALDVGLDYLTGFKKYHLNDLKLLEKYNKASNHGKEFITSILDFECLYTEFENNQKHNRKVPCLEPTGSFNDGVLYDTCVTSEVETYLKNVYMAIKIPTNSYLPTYAKGDIVFLEKRIPQSGEIAVFYKDNLCYFRQFIYHESTKEYILKSLSIQSTDIVLKSLKDYHILGTFISIDRTTD